MKVVLLAGGMGSRLSEETTVRPKPMVEIGGIPILVHIMRIYASHGFREFVIACGYKGEYIKEYFWNYVVKHSDWQCSLREGTRSTLHSKVPDWSITVVDTGLHTMTSGRLRRLRAVIGDEPFMVTYGDGVSDVDIGQVVAFHRAHGKLATVTAVHPPARFGGLGIEGDQVVNFSEKPQTEAGWINGGFFVFEPAALDYMGDDTVPLEREPLERLAADNQLMAYKHAGFWQPMDTLREKEILEKMWSTGQAPWKTWSDSDDNSLVLPISSGNVDGSHGIQGDVAGRVA